MSSRLISPTQERGISRVGDVMLPGTESMPPFSGVDCMKDVDRVLAYVPPTDLSDLKMLLVVLAYMPGPLLRGFVWLLEQSTLIPLPGILRVIRLGLRGIVMSLYYGHPAIHQKLGYQVSVYLDDRKA